MTETTQRLDVAALKRRHPLAAVMAAHGVELRPAGTGRFMGRCPFHDDQRPSLLVDERDQHFHCFGCGARGDVIDFLLRHLRLDFRAAVERLEQTPPRKVAPPSQRRRGERRWDRLTLEEQVVMNTAAVLYRDALWHTPPALAYLRGRGLPDWLIRRCALGYADGHTLEGFLRRRSGLRVAKELGLLGPGGRERLARRVVVPEMRAGHCLWFIGRLLADEGDRPRYLALGGERPLLGQERVTGRRDVFICEGVFDFLTALSWGLPACSVCGTALPEERLGFLARARAVYGVFDGDAAGQAASARLQAVLGSRARPIALPEGLDMNDLGRQEGGKATFFALLAAARRTREGGLGHAALA